MKKNRVTTTSVNANALSSSELGMESPASAYSRSLSRREFCALTAALGVTTFSAKTVSVIRPAVIEISLAIHSKTTLAKVPADYMGLSYESGQLAYPDYFSPQNTALIQMFRALSPAGVLRMGGNLSEFTAWSDTEPVPPPEAGGLVGPDPGHREPRTFTITPRSIRICKAFSPRPVGAVSTASILAEARSSRRWLKAHLWPRHSAHS